MARRMGSRVELSLGRAASLTIVLRDQPTTVMPSTMPRPNLFFLCALVFSSVAPAGHADEAAWAALRDGGAVAMMRHALAPGTGDPRNFTLGDCSTQRNLDERGRTQARAIGEAFRANGIEVDRVFSSQWCRCLETAELLGLGDVEPLPALNSFFADRSTRAAQTEAALGFLADLPPETTPLLVTHQVNISALTGHFTTSGEIIVFSLSEDGAVDVVGELNIDW